MYNLYYSLQQEVEDAIEGLCNLLPGDYGKDVSVMYMYVCSQE